jgi:predicted RNase H-like HicB family nuclease
MARRRRLFRIVIEPAEETPTDWYLATSPDLPGLATQGQGLDDTIEMVKDALLAYFDGKPPLCSLDVRITVPG